MPRRGGKVSDIDACGLTYTELMELWLGPHPTTGSCFGSREELVAAWAAGRAVVMRLWACGGRRPQAWWHLGDAASLGLTWPGYDAEKSYLYAAGALAEGERVEVEAEWHQAFDQARGKSAKERREAYEFADIPDELIEQWTPQRKRRLVASVESPSRGPVNPDTVANSPDDGLRQGEAATK